MTLTAGARLGPYEIANAIGAGGMGEVYRARDTKLDREVAIKVLPEDFSSDAERVARFEREAKLLASLNHPNIASIHGFEESDGVKALVLELVEGPTLAERIEQGPIPIEEALPIARQIAEALEAGHEAGVIHRDLKPANVKLKDDGTVKVLDYGLAKAFEGTTQERAAVELSQSPTLIRQDTELGVILGTAAYMSPEQARGKLVDKRTDVWAFGVVLFEMLTGARLFEAEDVSLTLAAVMKDEPSWERLPDKTPRAIETLLRRCLNRDVKRRLRDVGEARVAIEDAIARRSDGETASMPSAARNVWQRAAPWIMLVLAVALGLSLWRGDRAEPGRLMRASILAPEGTARAFRHFAVSPDERLLAFDMIDADGRALLAVRPFASLEARTLEDTEGAAFPFWSPDSRTIAFFANGKLETVPADGGPSQVICELPSRRRLSGTWNEDGVILFGTGAGPVYRVPATGGEPTAVTTVDRDNGELGHYGPQFFPDGRRFFFLKLYESPTAESRSLYVASLDAPGETHIAVPRGPLADTAPRSSNGALYLEPGYLVFVGADYSVFAQPFDLDRLELTGQPSRIATEIDGQPNFLSFSVAGRRTLVFLQQVFGGAGDERLVWRDRSGTVQGELGNTWTFGLSHDATRIAVNLGEDRGLHLLTPGRSGGPIPLGKMVPLELEPVWSPDDRHIIYLRIGAGLVLRTVELEEERLLDLPSDLSFFPEDWSPDGKTLTLTSQTGTAGRDIWLYSIEEEAGEPFLDSAANETGGVFSPDGRVLAYASDESGDYNVYVRPLTGTRSPVRISPDGGLLPEWRQDGRELFYVRPDGTLMAAPVEGTSSYGEPKPLFRSRPPGSLDRDLFDATADGERFLVLERTADPLPLTVIQNWTELLEP